MSQSWTAPSAEAEARALPSAREHQRLDLGLDARERLGSELGGHVPDLELAVAAAGGQGLAVGGQGQRCRAVRGVPGSEGLQMAVRRVPAAERAVVAAGDQGVVRRAGTPADRPVPACARSAACSVPVATSQSRVMPSRLDDARVAPSGEKATASIASAMPFERVADRARGQVPDLHGPVERAGGQRLAVGRERHAGDRAGVPGEGRPLGGLGDVPERHRGVAAARGERLAVGRERHARDRAGVARPAWPALAGGEVPELDDLAVAAGGQGLAVGAEGQGADRSGGVAKPPPDLMGRRVPEGDVGLPVAVATVLPSGADRQRPRPGRGAS